MTALEPMEIEERYAYLQRMAVRYRAAQRSVKSQLLDEMEAHTGLHRKSLLRRLKGPVERQPRQRERGKTYGAEVDAALALIWEALDYVCPARLTPQLVTTAERLAAYNELRLTPQLRQQLATISRATVGRHLPAHPLPERKRRFPAAPNRHQAQIPAYRIARDIGTPGYLEVDLVHHGGPTATGEYIYTLQCVDVATSWCGRRAILGRGAIVVADALHYLLQHWPATLQLLHPDNGSEFLNDTLLAFLAQYYPELELARSRPRCPNDNRLVEQKNDTGVRRYLGDRRLDTVQQTRYLNRIYERLDTYSNYFLPVMHQIDKVWVPTTEEHGGYLRRKHDVAQAPLTRLLATDTLTVVQTQQLQDARDALNPLQEHRDLQAMWQHLFAYPNATPGHTENVFETLTYVDLFPAAVVALQAGDSGDKANSDFAPTAPSPTTTTTLLQKEDMRFQ